jgi:hypothetical protein
MCGLRSEREDGCEEMNRKRIWNLCELQGSRSITLASLFLC